MAISPETLRLLDRRAVTINGITDETTRELVRSWSRAWDSIADDLTDALEVAASRLDQGQRLTQRELSRVERFSRALNEAAEQLDDLAASGRVTIRNSVGEMARVATELDPLIIASQYPTVAGDLDVLASRFRDRAPSDAVNQIVRRSGEQITAATRPLSAEATARMRRELTRGITAGTNPRQTARRMVGRLEGGFNGGLSRATMIARTEQLDAMRSASQVMAEANTDILQGQKWYTELDDLTCPACVAQHGTEWPADAFGPEGHQSCRCTFVPITRSWRDLGFDVDEPEDFFPSRDEWWSGLDDTAKNRVMGPGRLQALDDGVVSLDDLAMRRTTDGWRDSFVPRSVGDLIGAGA